MGARACSKPVSLPPVFRAAAAMAYQSIGEVLPSEHGKGCPWPSVFRWASFRSYHPWNFPGILSSRGFAIPMVAGNSIVLKPSEETPYCGGIFFAEVFDAIGLPEGAFNVVTCSRDNIGEIGDELIENPIIKGVSFTGSTAVGRMIAAKAGAHLKKTCVELGGKDALIICDDADLEKSAQLANFGSFMHQGQICMSVEKVLVHEKSLRQVPADVHRAGPQAEGRRPDHRPLQCHWSAHQRQAGRYRQNPA